MGVGGCLHSCLQQQLRTCLGGSLGTSLTSSFPPTPPAADITKVAERTISDDLEFLISKTVDTTKADYAGERVVPPWYCAWQGFGQGAGSAQNNVDAVHSALGSS